MFFSGSEIVQGLCPEFWAGFGAKVLYLWVVQIHLKGLGMGFRTGEVYINIRNLSNPRVLALSGGSQEAERGFEPFHPASCA